MVPEVCQRVALGTVAWTSPKFKRYLGWFRVTRYVILNVILYAFYEWNEAKKRQPRIQNDALDDIMRYVKWSQVSLKFKWRQCNRA